jgi:hypothetical protein
MPRRIMALITLLIALVGLAPIKAAAQRWSAWMYDYSTGQMLLLTDLMEGTPQPLALPMLSGFNTYERTVGISHDWHYIAYVVTNSGTGAKSLAVYDRNSGAVSYNFPVGANDSVSVGFAADELIFNETSTGIAFGYSINGMQGWEVKVVQLGGGAAIPTLRHDNPAVTALGIRREFVLPTIRRYRGPEVTFNMIYLATEGSPHYDSYTWNVTTGQVRRDSAYPSLSTDTYVPTGETISAQIDARFPSCGEACGPFFSGNVLSVYNPAVNGLFPVHTTRDAMLFRPVFIQNGERILFGSSGPSNMDRADWSVLERNGTLVGNLPSGIIVDSVTGWQDGFLYLLTELGPSAAPQLVVVNTRDGLDLGTTVWTGAPGSQPKLVQTPGNMQSTGPFVAWRQLAPPSTSVSAPESSTAALTVGRQAIVNTTQGDKLRMRSGPGRSFAVVLLLDKGTLVTLLEGPRSADGLTWWRIRAPNGTEGWVVESITDNGSFIQTLIPA